MKKFLYLILPTMALLLSACSISHYGAIDAAGIDRGISIPSPLPSPGDSSEPGVYLTISNRSSLNIDVNCILDFVQGAPALTEEIDSVNRMRPWIRWNWSF